MEELMHLNNKVLSKKKKVNRSSIYQTALGLLGFLVLIVTGHGMALAEKIPEETSQKLKGLRIPFIMNQGQVDPQVVRRSTWGRSMRG